MLFYIHTLVYLKKKYFLTLFLLVYLILNSKKNKNKIDKHKNKQIKISIIPFYVHLNLKNIFSEA